MKKVKKITLAKESGLLLTVYQSFVVYCNCSAVTGNDQDYLRKIPRAVVQISALLLKGHFLLFGLGRLSTLFSFSVRLKISL